MSATKIAPILLLLAACGHMTIDMSAAQARPDDFLVIYPLGQTGKR
jgi:hypothetical protein